MPSYTCPVERYGFNDEGTFARDTIVTRWPVILKDTAATVSAAVEKHASPSAQEQGRKIVQQIDALRQEIADDMEVKYIVEDGGSNIALYNSQIDEFRANGQSTWFSLNWLWAECYLYRHLRTFFALQPEWKQFDPYFTSKTESFRSSSEAVIKLAQATLNLSTTPSTIQQFFHTNLQLSLWGNASDLSLLAGGVTDEELRKLQSRGEEEKKMILRNDEEKVWEWISGGMGGKRRADIVLDNAGFELFTDMIFADFLLTQTPFFDQVVFHPKTIPWFCSDVLPADFRWILKTLLSPADFFPASALTPETTSALVTLAERWQAHVDAGRFKLSVPLDSELGDQGEDYWTNGNEYQRMGELSPELVKELGRESGLVVFKGDLNYRKLTVDAKWPSTTPFDEVLGPLNGAFPLLSLRTNKAEVIVGLEEGIEARLDMEDPKWRFNGKWAVVSFAPKI